MSLEDPNDNYPDGTWAHDPRAPWNQRTPAESGRTCGGCSAHYIAAPEGWAEIGFGWCPERYDYVRATDEACGDWSDE